MGDKTVTVDAKMIKELNEDIPTSFEDMKMIEAFRNMAKEIDFANYNRQTRIIREILDDMISDSIFIEKRDIHLAIKRLIFDFNYFASSHFRLLEMVGQMDKRGKRQEQQIKELQQTIENLAEIINKREWE